jgi:hypothetical protein
VKTTTRTDVTVGWDAYDANGEKIGSIQDQGDRFFVVSKGTLFKKDIYVPTSAIARTDPNERRVYLNVTKDDVEAMGWDDPNSVAAQSGVDASTRGGFDTTPRGTGYDAAGYDTTTPSGLGDETREPAGTGSMRTTRTGYGDEDDLATR